MLQILLIVTSVLAAYLAVKCLNYKIGCLATVMFFLDHGAREPDDEELGEYKRKVLENTIRDILHKPI